MPGITRRLPKVNSITSSEKPMFPEESGGRGKKPKGIKSIESIESIKSIIRYANPMDMRDSGFSILEICSFDDFGFYSFSGFYPAIGK